MSDAFVVYVRHGEKVLILQRSDEVADFPGAWDGVYGVGDPEDIDAVTTRVTECTGIPADALQYVRSGPARGLAFGNRLNDVTPLLFIAESDEVTPRTIYKNHSWVDPAYIGNYESESSEGTGAERYSIPQIDAMYGDVAAFLYILKTSIGQEENVAKEIRARLSGTGSLKDIQEEIFGVLVPGHVRGYIFLEVIHQVEPFDSSSIVL